MHSGPRHEDKIRAGERAFFGRRKGKRLRSHQARLMETLLPKLALDLTSPAPPDLATMFAPGTQEVRLEIGFGGGEHLLAEAQRHPQVGYIGVEPFVNGMAKALAAIEKHQLANIRLHHGDAAEVIAWLPDGALARVDLIYPDPWPKRRHWKRRFVQERMVSALARVLQPGGVFRFASDVADYAAWTLIRFLRSPAFEWTAEKVSDWQAPWPGFDSTRYEAKARREGRAPCYLTFCRRDQRPGRST